MNNLKIMPSIFLMILTILIACSRYPRNPEEVIKVFYKAANEGRYEEAKKYLSQEFASFVDGTLAAAYGGWKGVVDEITYKGKLEKVEVTDMSIHGEGASCVVKKYYNDVPLRKNENTFDQLRIELVKEEGKWKISLGRETPLL